MTVAGCKVDSSEEKYVNIVEEAYYVYCVTGDYVLSPVLSVLDRALKVDMYVRADQYGRYELEDMYFPEYKVRLSSLLMDGASLYLTVIPFSTKGLSGNVLSTGWRLQSPAPARKSGVWM